MNIIEEVKKLKCGEIKENIDLRLYTTYKAGGTALGIIYPETENQLIKLLKFLRNNEIKHKIIGNGSNLLFGDETYEGILINLCHLDYFKINRLEITVGAGYNLIKLAMKAARYGLAGLEFASGIPGTIGGAVYMNAGAYNSDMGYIVKEVKALTPDYRIITIKNKDLGFHYRTSFFHKNPGFICIEATIRLRKGDKNTIMEVIVDRKKRRLASQPLEYPSAGSVFRNPEGDFAGRMIEELGYKGKNIGGAEVSEKHANFVINKGNAKGNDIKHLIIEIKEKVKEKYGVELKIEQEFVE